jgi:glycerol-3-phosphate dehydrogenase
LPVAARLVVNATGGAVNDVLRRSGIAAVTPTLEAMNLVTRREAQDFAVGAADSSGRNLFIVPWRGRAIFGTWERRETAAGDNGVAPFLAALNTAFPSLNLAASEIALVHRGIVPAVQQADGTFSLRRHEEIRDHTSEGCTGLVTVAGTKYTTARGVAERVVDLVSRLLGRPPVTCRTAVTPLPEAGISGDGSSVSEPDLVRAVRDEMAVTLSDAVIRRTPLGAVGYPGDVAVGRAAEIVGRELRWSEDRKREEIAAVRRFYPKDIGD